MTNPTVPPKRLACAVCTRRKVKCDKGDPCSNCVKSKVDCTYEAPPVRRPRKRAPDEDLLNRLAQYECLMREHNIDFSYHANTWVTPGLEPTPKGNDPKSPVSMVSTASPSNPKHQQRRDSLAFKQRKRWTNLSPELKNPPIQSLSALEDPLRHPEIHLQLLFPADNSELYKEHPDPRQIYHHWQLFIERINPLTKVIHVPTLQQRILDASWDPINISKSLAALMFAIYSLSLTSMTPDECLAAFGQSKDILLTRYRSATFRALFAAEFLTTKNLEVLQASFLFLSVDPESPLTTTLTSTVLKVAQLMGLHREDSDPKMSFFEKEMRIRLWWQLVAMESRGRATIAPGATQPSPSEPLDVRFPLNANDADLHPDMMEPPAAHDTPTEMMYVLMKLEIFKKLRSSPVAARAIGNIIRWPVAENITTELEDKVVKEIETIYNEKYLSMADVRIPLHGMCESVSKLAIARMRFKLHHPRGSSTGSNREDSITREESDILFESAVTWLEESAKGARGRFFASLFRHMIARFQLDPCIYILSDLRWRCRGDRVTTAWALIEGLYNDHPELIEDTGNTFFWALGDLTLSAWETRSNELSFCKDTQGIFDPPQFIQLLLERRQEGLQDVNLAPHVPDPHILDRLALTDNNEFNWESWNELMRF